MTFYSDLVFGLINIILCLLVYYIIKFYWNYLKYPKGPFPLPFLGNLLLLRGISHSIASEFANLQKKYGRIFTFWVGSQPAIFINDYELVKKIFNSKNNEFMGRPKNVFIRKLVTENKYNDVVFSDYGPVWASLRRVGHAAVRKYAVSDEFGHLVNEMVKDVSDFIKTKEGINKPFNPIDYLCLTVINILASSAFGKRYAFDDKELLKIKTNFEEFRKETDKAAVIDIVPILKPLYYRAAKNIENNFKQLKELTLLKYKEHLNDYQEGLVRDFSDALIAAKNEAIIEEKETAPYLNDDNLSLVLVDLFLAGSDTTQYTLRWIMFFMAKYPEMQKRIRIEVENNIGDRIVLYEDKDKLNYVYAFISECLRYRTIAPIGVPHSTMCDAELDEFTIPQDTFVFSFNWSINNDKKYWDNPDVFNPDRFLENDGKFTTKQLPLVPFGIGRRICLGERLAMADLFLITVKLIQTTQGLTFAFPYDNPDFYDDIPDPKVFGIYSPKPYKIILKK